MNEELQLLLNMAPGLRLATRSYRDGTGKRYRLYRSAENMDYDAISTNQCVTVRGRKAAIATVEAYLLGYNEAAIHLHAVSYRSGDNSVCGQLNVRTMSAHEIKRNRITCPACLRIHHGMIKADAEYLSPETE